MNPAALPMALKTFGKRQLVHFLKSNAGLSNHASVLLRRFDYEAQGVKIAMRTGFVPAVIPIHLRGQAAKGRFKMRSQNGKDLIATTIWFKGWEGFERPLPDVFAALSAAAGDSLVLDVGANTGFYSLIATAVNTRLEVHAFEPFPPVKALLTENLGLNDATRVHVFDQAVSDTKGTTKLYVPLQDHGLVESSCSLNPQFKEAHSAAIDVGQVTLDEHVQRFPRKRISLVKIDVEGFEDHVLRGAARTLAEHRPTIVLEVLPIMDQERLDQLRRQLGYTSYRFRNGRVVREERVQFDNDSWNHLWLPEEGGFPSSLAAYAAVR